MATDTVAPPGTSARHRRARRLQEARGQAVVLATVLWVAAGWLLSTPGESDRFGKVKGTDFAHFYAFGAVAREGRADLMYDDSRLHAVQAALVPASARDHFFSVYPPQVALVFAPFSAMPYLWAFGAWSVLTIAGYGWAVRAGWTTQRTVLPGGWTVAVFAASFPPLWYLVLHGQSTLLVLAGFALAGWALERSRPAAAGLALGLLACKPQWAPVVGVVLIVRGEWRMTAGMLLSVAAQAVLVWLVLGAQPLLAYGRLLPAIPALPLAPKPYLMHSVAAWTDLLPDPVGPMIWIGVVAGFVIIAVRAWRADVPVPARLGVLVVAAALASPHPTIYDATVLALPLVWWAGLVEREPDRWPHFYRLMYALWFAYLFPTALLIGLQLSVLVLATLYWQSRRLTAAGVPGTTATPPALRR